MLQQLKPRLLVIDDDPTIGTYLSRVFAETGRYSIEVETDPIVAMTVALGYRPDLLIVDIYMPGMSGLELAAQLRSEPRLLDRPILFFTGMAKREELPPRAEGEAPIEYLAKGGTAAEIVATVDRLLGIQPPPAGRAPALAR